MRPYGTNMTNSRHGNALEKKHQETIHQDQKSYVLMDITVTVSVLTLNGILSRLKKKNSKVRNDSDEGVSPVAAVVSFSKNVKDSETSIASHFPSLPLHQSIQHSDSSKQRHIASWPKEFDLMGNKLGTFTFSRVMKFVRLSPDCLQCVPERVELSIGLRRGSEMIKLGTSSLVVIGNESHKAQMNLPVNSNAFSKSWRKKPAYFTNDPNCKYSLDQNSCLKVLVDVAPTGRSIDSINSNLSWQGLQHLHSGSIPSSDRSESTKSSMNSNKTGNESNAKNIDENQSYISSGISVYDNRGGIDSDYSSNHYTENNLLNNHTENSINASPSYDVSLSSSVSDLEYHVAKENDGNINNISKPLLFCGGLMNYIMTGTGENLNCEKSCQPIEDNKRNWKKLKKKVRNRSFKSIGLDVDSVMPTYRIEDDNESQFIPPSKIYAGDYGGDEADSLYGERQDYHSVVTEKLNNRSSSSF